MSETDEQSVMVKVFRVALQVYISNSYCISIDNHDSSRTTLKVSYICLFDYFFWDSFITPVFKIATFQREVDFYQYAYITLHFRQAALKSFIIHSIQVWLPYFMDTFPWSTHFKRHQIHAIDYPLCFWVGNEC